METCLQPLWELIREPMLQIIEKSNVSQTFFLSEKQAAATKSKALIDLFFKNLEDRIGKRKASVKEIEVIAPKNSFGKIIYTCRHCAQSVL